VANALRNDVDFVTISDKSIANSEGATFPGVILYRKFDTPKVHLELDDGSINSEALTKFVKTETFPAFGEIGPDNYQKYVERDLPLVWTFAEYADDKIDQTLFETVQSVARNFRQFGFVHLDGVKWASHAKNYGVNSAKLPGVVIENRAARKNYLYPDQTITAKDLTEWLQHYLDGKIHANVKSQEVPASQDESVYTLVGKKHLMKL